MEGGLSEAIFMSLQQKADKLKPDTEIVVQLTQQQLQNTVKGKLKNGAFFEYNPKENKVVIYKASDPECVTGVMFEDGENIKEAEDVCSDEIKISLDVEGLDERVAQKEQQVAKWQKAKKVVEDLAKEQQDLAKEQQDLAKWQKAKKVVEDVAKEKQELASTDSELMFTGSIIKVLKKIDKIVDNRRLTDKDISELENYIYELELGLKGMRENRFLSMTDKERKMRITRLRKILGLMDFINTYNKKEIERLNKTKQEVRNVNKIDENRSKVIKRMESIDKIKERIKNIINKLSSAGLVASVN